MAVMSLFYINKLQLEIVENLTNMKNRQEFADDSGLVVDVATSLLFN